MPSKSLNWRERLARIGKYWYLRVVRLKAEPHNIAIGLALGIFVGFLPIIPFQSVVVIALAVIFRGNKLAAWVATFISNPVDMVPFYLMLFVIGKFMLTTVGFHFDPDQYSLEFVRVNIIERIAAGDMGMLDIIRLGGKFFLVMVAGGLFAGIPASIALLLTPTPGSFRTPSCASTNDSQA